MKRFCQKHLLDCEFLLGIILPVRTYIRSEFLEVSQNRRLVLLYIVYRTKTIEQLKKTKVYLALKTPTGANNKNATLLVHVYNIMFLIILSFNHDDTAPLTYPEQPL